MNETEKRILLSLVTNRVRIPEIIKAANISKATFHRVVEEMVKNEYVSKEIAVNQGYPPPVYYTITEKGKEVLKKALKVDEFLEKFEKGEIEAIHILVLNHITNLLFYGRGVPKREELEYEAIAILAGWIESKNGTIELTKGGWRAIFKYLPTRQLQNLQILLAGLGRVEVDEELENYIANLTAISQLIAREASSFVPEKRGFEFEMMVKERMAKLEKEIERKVRKVDSIKDTNSRKERKES